MPKRKSRSELSKALIELRKRLGETQESLARRLNVSLQTVALWETKRPPQGIVLLLLFGLAEKHQHADLAKIFNEAVENEPPVVRDGLHVEQRRWETILLGLNEIQSEVAQLDSVAPLSAMRIRQIASHIGTLALEARSWSWRN
jgi:transcriptional regulator with XRE-family HTH domain